MFQHFLMKPPCGYLHVRHLTILLMINHYLTTINHYYPFMYGTPPATNLCCAWQILQRHLLHLLVAQALEGWQLLLGDTRGEKTQGMIQMWNKTHQNAILLGCN